MIASVRGVLPVLLTCLLLGCAGDISDAEHVEKARQYLAAGDNNAAVIELKNALRQNSENPQARLLLGKLHFEVGAYADAVKELDKAAEFGASDADVLPVLSQALLGQNELDTLNLLAADSLPPEARGRVLASQAWGKLRSGDVAAAALLIEQSAQDNPEDVYVLFVQARLLAAQSRGDFTLTREQLQRVFQLDPDYAPAWSLLGDIELNSQDLEAAERAFQRVVSASENNFDERYKLGLIHLQMEKFDEAREDAVALEKRLPGHPAPQYLLGIVNYQGGNLSEAVTNFYAASQYEDQYPLSLFYLGVIQSREGDLAQAETNAARFLAPEPDNVPGRKLLATIKLQTGDAAEAERLVRSIVESNGADVGALNILATALLAQGKTEEGTKLLVRVVELQPDSAMAQSRLAAGLLSSGEVEGGLERIETALVLDPQLQQADYLLISAHLGQQNYEAALEAIDEFEEKNPESAGADNMRGGVYLKAGKKEEAEKSFSRVLDSSPGDPDANHNLALLALQANDVELASSYYQNVLEYDENHLVSLLNLASLNKQESDYEAMIDYLDRAIAAHPNDVRPRIFLARHYLTLRQFDKVPLVLGQLDETGRLNPDVLNVEGLTQLESGQYFEAQETFSRLIELRPDAPQPHYHLGLAYRGLGDNKQMITEFQEAIKISPEYLNPRIELTRALLYSRDRDAAVAQLAYLQKIAPGHPEVLQLDAVRAGFDGDQAEALRLSQLVFDKAPSTRNLLVLSRQNWMMGQREASQHLLESWVDQHPGDISVRSELASVYESFGKKQQAIAQYKALLQEDGDNVLALNNLAWELRNTDPVLALSYAEQAVKNSPENAAAIDTLAVVQFKNDDNDRAQRTIARALKVDPDNPAFLYHSAMIMASKGDSDRAIITLKAVLAEEREFAEREDAEQLLAQLQ